MSARVELEYRYDGGPATGDDTTDAIATYRGDEDTVPESLRGTLSDVAPGRPIPTVLHPVRVVLSTPRILEPGRRYRVRIEPLEP